VIGGLRRARALGGIGARGRGLRRRRGQRQRAAVCEVEKAPQKENAVADQGNSHFTEMIFCEKRKVDACDLVRLEYSGVGAEAKELDLAAHLSRSPRSERHSQGRYFEDVPIIGNEASRWDCLPSSGRSVHAIPMRAMKMQANVQGVTANHQLCQA
jgi:hypothetical protein